MLTLRKILLCFSIESFRKSRGPRSLCEKRFYAPHCGHLLLISAVHFLTRSWSSLFSCSVLASMTTRRAPVRTFCSDSRFLHVFVSLHSMQSDSFLLEAQVLIAQSVLPPPFRH